MNPIVMTIVLLVALGLFAFSMYRRIVVLFAFRGDVRWDNIWERMGKAFSYAFFQKRFFRKWELLSGLAHVAIFWGFLILGIRVVWMVMQSYIPGFNYPLFDGPVGSVYWVLQNIFILAVLFGVGVGLIRRLLTRPKRLLFSAEAVVILLLITTIVTTDALYDAVKFNYVSDSHEIPYAFLGTMLAPLFSGLSSDTLATLLVLFYWINLGCILAFLNFLPYGKHFHVVTAIPNTFFYRLGSPGALSKLDFEKDEEYFGAGRLEDLPWKAAMDMFTCTECGRCSAGCPAWLTDKPLDPRKIITKERDHLKEYTPFYMQLGFAKLKGNLDEFKKLAEETERPALIGDIQDPEAIWSCTSCRHCQYSCPVTIEHVDNIIEMRRYLVQAESKFPKELTNVFKGIEQNGNPWNLGANKRQDWIEGLDVPVMAELSEEERGKLEFLFWVGCAGSFDERNIKISKALVKIFKRAGLNFAILGNEETCTGDSARRAGNEYLFQTMAQANIERLGGYGVKKIVTACPHCFNTLKNEYPSFGGNYEVIHHSVLIAELIKSGRIRLEGKTPYKVVFHDPCYLGRYSSIYDEPREVIGAIPGITQVESARNKDLSFCCGGGGARVWMEEHIGRRVNQERALELNGTDANIVAVACPFCIIMLEDAIGAKNLDEKMKVRDISELVSEAMG
ncbi:MAG: heterodisulfide reductase-related iron-sulfur binding cluster [Myxococcota bacterium]